VGTYLSLPHSLRDLVLLLITLHSVGEVSNLPFPHLLNDVKKTTAHPIDRVLIVIVPARSELLVSVGVLFPSSSG
jgi:hypothetical protein